MKKLVITGAAGSVGQQVVPFLAERYRLRLADVVAPTYAIGEAEFVKADIRDPAQLRSAFEGADAVIHLGAVGGEDDWDRILELNINGTYNALESARLESVGCFVYSSSVHAIGFYPRNERIDSDNHVRPDSRYGLSKCFGEAACALFADKYGMRTMAVRIGNVSPPPAASSEDEATEGRPVRWDERRLSIWVSARDLAQLFAVAIDNEGYNYALCYGVSNNQRSWWDNSIAYELGYKPEDDSEEFAAQLLENGPIEDIASLGATYQGGGFVDLP